MNYLSGLIQGEEDQSSNGGSKFLKKTDDKLEINSLIGKKFSSSNIGDLSYSRINTIFIF